MFCLIGLIILMILTGAREGSVLRGPQDAQGHLTERFGARQSACEVSTAFKIRISL